MEETLNLFESNVAKPFSQYYLNNFRRTLSSQIKFNTAW